MKHYMLALVSVIALAAWHGADAQTSSGSEAGGVTGDWDFRVGPIFTESKNIGFKGGSTADIKSAVGVKFGSGYHITDHFIVGGNFSYAESDFNGIVQGNNGVASASASIENGHVSFSTLMFDASYTLLDGPIKPFGAVGLGWNWVNTNIRNGPPQAGCWYDPWWGYVCNGYQPTHGSNGFAYQLGAGVQFNFNRQFAIDADYKFTWVDLHHANSTPGIGGAELLLVWRFTTQYQY
jgi:opacity protein-like surface antigen